jgi:hypothetical protein
MDRDADSKLKKLPSLPRGFLGRYRVERVLGQGSYGVVVLASDRQLRRDVAVKFLKAEAVARPDLAARFRREAKLMASLEHPNVVRVFDTELEGPAPFLVMEFVEGCTLQDRLAAETPSPAEALRIAAEILAGLGAAHRGGIIHRDLKPSNVMLDAAGTARLTDFGLARGVEGEADSPGGQVDASRTADGVILGTLHFVAPEVLLRQRATPASDLYAVGVILHRMLYGELPYSVEMLLAAADGTPLQEPVLQPVAGVRAEALAALAASLSPEPARRPATAGVFASALGGVANVGVEPASKLAAERTDRGRSQGRRKSLSQGARQAAGGAAPARPRRAGWLLAGGVLVAMGVLAGVWWRTPGAGEGVAAAPGNSAAPGGAAPAAARPSASPLSWVRVGTGSDRITLSWQTRDSCATRLQFRPEGVNEFREVRGQAGATTAHTLTVAGLAPGVAHRFRLDTGAGGWTGDIRASTLAVDPACRAVSLAEQTDKESALHAASSGQQLGLLTSSSGGRMFRLFLSHDDGLTWCDGLPLLGESRTRRLGVVAGADGEIHLFWVDALEPDNRLWHASFRLGEGRQEVAKGWVELPGPLMHPPCALVRPDGEPSVLAVCGTEDPEAPALAVVSRSGGEAGSWRSHPLAKLEAIPRRVGGAVLEGDLLYVLWTVPEGLAEAIVLDSFPAGGGPRRTRLLAGHRARHGGDALLVSSAAGGGLAVFYNLPPAQEGEPRPGVAGGSTERRSGQPAAVFLDNRELAESDLVPVLIAKGGARLLPRLSFSGALGSRIGLVAEPGGFLLTFGEMDLLAGPVFALSHRCFDEVRQSWGPPQLLGPNPYGVGSLALARTARTLHTFVRTTFTSRLLYWRVPRASGLATK